MEAVNDPRGYWDDLTATEQGVTISLAFVVGVLLLGMVGGTLSPSYFLFLIGLGGMFALLSLGLNTQWGFSGLINFSVAAFFGLGAYGTALLTASNSPLRGVDNPLVEALLGHPLLGLLFGLVLAALVAVAVGIPTLRLRADYLAIASLGLAEVVRLVALNENQWTAGSRGLRGIPRFHANWPVLGSLPEAMPTVQFELVPGSPVELRLSFWQQLLNVSVVIVFLLVAMFVLRRALRSPWGRVLRTIKSNEGLAKALGKDTYSFKMQAWVLGSVIMALGGVFYAHLNLFVNPVDLEPITTFYVWVAVILGGTGSNRGALLGGFVVVAIREGSRLINEIPLVDVSPAPFRLLVIGVLIILVMRFRPQGVLPPQRELIWSDTVDESAPKTPQRGVRKARGGDSDD